MWATIKGAVRGGKNSQNIRTKKGKNPIQDNNGEIIRGVLIAAVLAMLVPGHEGLRSGKFRGDGSKGGPRHGGEGRWQQRQPGRRQCSG